MMRGLLAVLITLGATTANGGTIRGKVESDGRAGDLRVVYVAEIAGAVPTPRPVIIHIKSTFEPSAGVTSMASKVTFVNDDKETHLVKVLSGADGDIGELKPGAKKTVHAARGILTASCSGHEHHASLLVLQNDRYSVAAADGTYELANVPAGEYQVAAWSATHRAEPRPVRVEAAGAAVADFHLKDPSALAKLLESVGKNGLALGGLAQKAPSVTPHDAAPEPAPPGVTGLGIRGTGSGGSGRGAGILGGSGHGTGTLGGFESKPKSSLGSAPREPAPHKSKNKRSDREHDDRADELEQHVESAIPRDAGTSPSGGTPGPTGHAPAPIVAAPAMRAGRYDDNKQYNRFLAFLGENRGMVVYPVDVSERLLVRTLDKEGKSLSNCAVEVQDTARKALATSVSYADGSTQFFPTDAGPANAADYLVRARCGDETRNGQLSRTGRRSSEVRFTFTRQVPAQVPVDIAIVIDTTGSMQSQIDRLRKTLKAIHVQLTALSTRPDIRFALVAYRDRGDDYVTQPFAFTRDMPAFQRALDTLEADGGGDTPEDLQAALDDAMHKLQWRDDALRLGFLVSDAIPHTDYGEQYNYREAMRESLRRGIKWSMVGAGGLPREGEVIFRQIAQFSMGEYVFVTESGAGDHEGGVGEASHHVGTNYETENLDQAIVRIVRRELSYLTDAPKDFDDTIIATAKDGVPRDAVLAPAVAEVLRQLADYSSLRLKDATPVAIVPVTASDPKYKDVAGYITDKLTLSASRTPSFKVVERDMTALAQEMKLQLSDLFDVTETVPIGKLMGAEVLIVTKLTIGKDSASLFAKLVRVETGEVLSVAEVEIGANILKSS